MPNQETTPDTSEDQRRPGIITILSILIFLISLFYLVKFSQAIIQWEILASLPLTVSPLYLIGDGLVWSLIAGFLSWGLWSGKSWSPGLGIIISLAYAVVFWIDTIFLAEPGTTQYRWPINLVLSLVGLSAIFLILNLKQCRAYFNRNPAKIA
ncbi:MAG: hypothetical protein ACC633_09905 [Anaerolineales bacterium]